MASEETISESIIVVAIDFGTTFSGYAFAFKRYTYVMVRIIEVKHFQEINRFGHILHLPLAW
jgi:hypothetical protein